MLAVLIFFSHALLSISRIRSATTAIHHNIFIFSIGWFIISATRETHEIAIQSTLKVIKINSLKTVKSKVSNIFVNRLVAMSTMDKDLRFSSDLYSSLFAHGLPSFQKIYKYMFHKSLSGFHHQFLFYYAIVCNFWKYVSHTKDPYTLKKNQPILWFLKLGIHYTQNKISWIAEDKVVNILHRLKYFVFKL